MPVPQWIAAVVVAGLLVVSATACQSGDGGVSEPPPGATPTSPPSIPAPTSPAPNGAVSDALDFTTPTGNIRCNGSDSGGTDAYLQCEISDMAWRLPLIPEGECPFGDDGRESRRVGLGDTDAAQFEYCYTDAVGGGARLEGYGEPVRAGRFYCVARESGLRCENTDTGHGFELSQAAYEFF